MTAPRRPRSEGRGAEVPEANPTVPIPRRRPDRPASPRGADVHPRPSWSCISTAPPTVEDRPEPDGDGGTASRWARGSPANERRGPRREGTAFASTPGVRDAPGRDNPRAAVASRWNGGPRRALVAAGVGALLTAVLSVAVPGRIDSVDPPPSPGLAAGPTAAIASPPVQLDPGSFSDGGCVALRPVGPARATVLVDAGHGGPDPGSIGRTTEGRTVLEKQLTLPVALATAARLRERGIAVVMSRSTDDLGSTIEPGDVHDGALTTAASQDDLLSRVRCANTARADALVSIHFNSFEDPTVAGTETLYDVDRPFAPSSRALAQSLQTNIRERLAALGRPAPDRGVIDDSAGSEGGGGDLVLLGPRVPGRVEEPSTMPGALVEPLFMTNPDDLTAIASPRGTTELAEAISAGVEEYLDERRR